MVMMIVVMMLMVPTHGRNAELLEDVGDAVEVPVCANDEGIRLPIVVQVEANDARVRGRCHC
jgi:hypothetical protein